MPHWSASTTLGHTDVVARLTDGSVVLFHATPPKSPLNGHYWRATHRGRVVGGFEWRHEYRHEALFEWFDRIAAVAATKGPETVRDMGWYAQ